MDYLDEETVEVATQSAPSGGVSSLNGSALLKNRERDLIELARLNGYENPLLNAGTSLLASCVALSRMPLPEDMYRFRKTLIEQITELKAQITQLDYPASVADKCCFMFCIALDEFILHCTWGEDSGWENNTLVSELFGVRDGGEQFFLVAEKALLQPKLLSDFLELTYIFIKIGFRGQYRLHGREQLEDVMYRLEQAVFETNRPAVLANVPAPALPRVRKPRRPIRFGLQLVLCLCALILLFAGASYWYQSERTADARAFDELAQFNRKHLQGGTQKEAVYISVDTEMRLVSGQKALNIARVKSTVPVPVAQDEPVLTLEIAAFTSRLKAITFLRRDDLKGLQAQVIYLRDKYRVVVQSDSEAQAQALSERLQTLGYSDVFYYYHTVQEVDAAQ